MYYVFAALQLLHPQRPQNTRGFFLSNVRSRGAVYEVSFVWIFAFSEVKGFTSQSPATTVLPNSCRLKLKTNRVHLFKIIRTIHKPNMTIKLILILVRAIMWKVTSNKHHSTGTHGSVVLEKRLTVNTHYSAKSTKDAFRCWVRESLD